MRRVEGWESGGGGAGGGVERAWKEDAAALATEWAEVLSSRWEGRAAASWWEEGLDSIGMRKWGERPLERLWLSDFPGPEAAPGRLAAVSSWPRAWPFSRGTYFRDVVMGTLTLPLWDANLLQVSRHVFSRPRKCPFEIWSSRETGSPPSVSGRWTPIFPAHLLTQMLLLTHLPLLSPALVHELLQPFVLVEWSSVPTLLTAVLTPLATVLNDVFLAIS